MSKNLVVPDNSIAQLSLVELRRKWAELWDIKPHVRIGPALLERSLEFKLREKAGIGLTSDE